MPEINEAGFLFSFLTNRFDLPSTSVLTFTKPDLTTFQRVASANRDSLEYRSKRLDLDQAGSWVLRLDATYSDGYGIQGTQDFTVDPVPASTPGAIFVTVVDADCLAGDVVGGWVYITGPKVSGRFQVATADVTVQAQMPVFGVITAKPTSTTCSVQRAGEVSGIFGAALTPQERYYLQVGGGIGTSIPASGTGAAAMLLGMATDTDAMELRLHTKGKRA